MEEERRIRERRREGEGARMVGVEEGEGAGGEVVLGDVGSGNLNSGRRRGV